MMALTLQKKTMDNLQQIRDKNMEQVKKQYIKEEKKEDEQKYTRYIIAYR